MRITPDSLIRIAKETTLQRTHVDRSIVAVYLTGSLLTKDPFLGGATDIDLVFVHENEPAFRREIIPLTPEIHVDIRHNPRSEYSKPRYLRTHPWLGPELWDPRLLYETEPFFEFVQASVRDKYNEPVNMLQRSRTDVDHARQLWQEILMTQDSEPGAMLIYLKTINHAANAIAILNGPVLAERRFLLQFPKRAEALGKSGLTDMLLVLLGNKKADNDSLTALIPEWEKAFIEAANKKKPDARLHAARLGYYKLAMRAMIESGFGYAVLWPLLRTWTLAASVLPESKQKTWVSACKYLGLTGADLSHHLKELDQFLDEIEQMLENMAITNGLQSIYRDGRKVE